MTLFLIENVCCIQSSMLTDTVIQGISSINELNPCFDANITLGLIDNST